MLSFLKPLILEARHFLTATLMLCPLTPQKREFETLISDLHAAIASHNKAIEERDGRITSLMADAEKQSQSQLLR